MRFKVVLSTLIDLIRKRYRHWRINRFISKALKEMDKRRRNGPVKYKTVEEIMATIEKK